MRIKITISSDKKEVPVPVHYNNLVQGAIYNKIDDPGFREYLHSMGFSFEKRKFKLFTFSRLMGNFKFDKASRMLVFKSPIKLVISSPLSLLIKELGNGLIKEGTIRFGEEVLEIKDLEAYSKEIKEDRILVKMISPVVTYSTIEKEGRKFTYYYSPYEDRFQETIAGNLAKKASLIYESKPDKNSLQITPKKVSPNDRKIIKFKGTVIQGWLGKYELKGAPKLLETAYYAGLGSKNSQGFGCFELL